MWQKPTPGCGRVQHLPPQNWAPKARLPERSDKPFHKRSYDSLFVTFPKFLPKSGQSMPQQLVQTTPAGPARRIRRPAPAHDRLGADRPHRLALRRLLRRHHPQPQHPARPTTAPSRGSWTGASSRGLNRLDAIRPIHVAAYVEQLPLSRPSVRQHLSEISRCFDWMVSGGTLDTNPATSVQRPKTRRQGRQDPGPQ